MQYQIGNFFSSTSLIPKLLLCQNELTLSKFIAKLCPPFSPRRNKNYIHTTNLARDALTESQTHMLSSFPNFRILRQSAGTIMKLFRDSINRLLCRWCIPDYWYMAYLPTDIFAHISINIITFHHIIIHHFTTPNVSQNPSLFTCRANPAASLQSSYTRIPDCLSLVLF